MFVVLFSHPEPPLFYQFKATHPPPYNFTISQSCLDFYPPKFGKPRCAAACGESRERRPRNLPGSPGWKSSAWQPDFVGGGCSSTRGVGRDGMIILHWNYNKNSS